MSLIEHGEVRMHMLDHSNNTGTVGYTCIHALMNVADMRLCEEMAPEGYFTNTFFSPTHNRKWSSDDVMVEQLQDRLVSHKLEGALGFYYTFPRDEQGEVFLFTLKLMFGMKIKPNHWVRRRA